MSMETSSLAAVVDGIRHAESIDDRKLLVSPSIHVIRNITGLTIPKLEHALTFVSRLPPNGFSKNLQNKIVELCACNMTLSIKILTRTIVYNDLEHPPATSIGNKYAWRTADGSFNNTTLPDLGKSGTPYARSVQQSHALPKHELPDPGLIFDTFALTPLFIYDKH
jgi:hypothetical protein